MWPTVGAFGVYFEVVLKHTYSCPALTKSYPGTWAQESLTQNSQAWTHHDGIMLAPATLTKTISWWVLSSLIWILLHDRQRYNFINEDENVLAWRYLPPPGSSCDRRPWWCWGHNRVAPSRSFKVDLRTKAAKRDERIKSHQLWRCNLSYWRRQRRQQLLLEWGRTFLWKH